jgi:hypothetical protein
VSASPSLSESSRINYFFSDYCSFACPVAALLGVLSVSLGVYFLSRWMKRNRRRSLTADSGRSGLASCCDAPPWWCWGRPPTPRSNRLPPTQSETAAPGPSNSATDLIVLISDVIPPSLPGPNVPAALTEKSQETAYVTFDGVCLTECTSLDSAGPLADVPRQDPQVEEVTEPIPFAPLTLPALLTRFGSFSAWGGEADVRLGSMRHS